MKMGVRKRLLYAHITTLAITLNIYEPVNHL